MASTSWTPASMGDLSGRVVIITGANSGIGRTAATALAAAGAHVVLAVRDTAKGEQAAASIPGSREVRPLDLGDLASVRAFAAAWDGPVDVLINNAGVMAVPEGRTRDGFELQIGTNHFGHHALTNLLLPRVTRRVVTLASGAHRMGAIRLEDLNWDRPGSYDRWRAYGQSKLANLLFTLELQRRLTEAGSPVLAVAAHPGWAATNLQGRTENRAQDLLLRLGNRLLAQSEEQGALPTLYAATADVPPAAYVGPDGFQEARGNPTLVGRSAAASDPVMARRLWELSETLTGVGFPAPAAV